MCLFVSFGSRGLVLALFLEFVSLDLASLGLGSESSLSGSGLVGSLLGVLGLLLEGGSLSALVLLFLTESLSPFGLSNHASFVLGRDSLLAIRPTQTTETKGSVNLQSHSHTEKKRRRDDEKKR